MNYQPINFNQKLAKFDEYWSPKVIAQMNNYQLKLVKVKDNFVWHSHADTDEVFIVISGELEIEFRDGKVSLSSGEMYVVPILERVAYGGNPAAPKGRSCGAKHSLSPSET